jgi:hypothetical protein
VTYADETLQLLMFSTYNVMIVLAICRPMCWSTMIRPFLLLADHSISLQFSGYICDMYIGFSQLGYC